jgi:hypothetical protein
MRWRSLLLGLVFAGCYDFTADRRACVENQHCLPDDGGVTPPDAGFTDAGFIDAFFSVSGFGPCVSPDGPCWEFPPLTANTFSSVWTDGARLAAVGENGTLVRFDGAKWTAQVGLNMAPSLATVAGLQFVAGTSSGVRVLGGGGYLGQWSFEGGTYAVDHSASLSAPRALSLSADASTLWVVEDSRLSRAPFNGDFTAVDAGRVSGLHTVHAVNDDDVWLGGGTTLVHLEAGRTTALPTPGFETFELLVTADGKLVSAVYENQLYGVSVASSASPLSRAPVVMPSGFTGPNFNFLETPNGQLYLGASSAGAECDAGLACSKPWRCGAFTAFAAPPGSDDVVSVGTQGAVYFRSSMTGAWQPIQPCTGSFTTVLALADGGVIAAGAPDLVLERAADGWRTLTVNNTSSGLTSAMRGAWQAPDGTLWFAGNAAPWLSPLDGGATITRLNGLPLSSQPNLRELEGYGATAYAIGGVTLRYVAGREWRELDAGTAGFSHLAVVDGGAVLVGLGVVGRLEGDALTQLDPPLRFPDGGALDWTGVAAESLAHFWVCSSTSSSQGLYEFVDGGWAPPRAFPGAASGCTVLLRASSGDLMAGLTHGGLVRFWADGGSPSFVPTGIGLGNGIGLPNGTGPDVTALAEQGGRLYLGATQGALLSVPLK